MIENTAPTGLVTDEHKTLFRRERYMILDRVIPENVLQMLREECSYFLGYCDAQIDPGLETSNINYRDKRYFVSNRYRLSLRMHPFIFGPLMAEIARATLGPEAHLFNEQWVVKGAEQGMSFSWHQDSGYVNFYGGPREPRTIPDLLVPPGRRQRTVRFTCTLTPGVAPATPLSIISGGGHQGPCRVPGGRPRHRDRSARGFLGRVHELQFPPQWHQHNSEDAPSLSASV